MDGRGDDLGITTALIVLVVMVGGFLVTTVLTFVVAWKDYRATKAPLGQVLSAAPTSIGETLRTYYTAGRWNEIVQLLDASLPESPVAASLIEAARGMTALHMDVARARSAGVSEEITRRLEAQSETVAGTLWVLAERLVAAEHMGSRQLRTNLQREDEALVRLHGAITEAREGLAELTLSDAATWDELRWAEGHFRALAAAAREVRDFEREGLPW